MVAEIGAMDLTVRDVLSLQVGDVVRLQNTRVNDPMVLKIGNRRKFLCKPGQIGNKLAVQIIKQLEDIEQEEFEELAAEEGE
jgi:flagellar motor switch protein FliM